MNKRTILITVMFLLATFVMADVGFAGLINYKRKNAATTAAGKKDAPSVAKWMTTLPMVQSTIEQKYDVNRDGKLQTAEVKTFLRDVEVIVAAKGGYTVDSDVLKEYDKNRDGVINRYEVSVLKEHSR